MIHFSVTECLRTFRYFFAPAASLYDPSREKAILENPQIFQNCEIINILSAEDAQSEAERILNCPACGQAIKKRPALPVEMRGAA